MALSATAARPDGAYAAWGPRLALAAIIALTVVLRTGLLSVPLERDEGEYAYMGQLILRGQVPYVAAHNMKLPGVYYVYAAILALFGQSESAIRLGLLLLNVATIVVVYRLGRTLLDETAGVSAAAAYALLSLSHATLGLTANAEHFVILPMLAGVLALARLDEGRRYRHVATAGILLGVAYVMKQHAAAFVAFGGLCVLVDAARRRSLRDTVLETLVFSAAALAPFALVCVLMYAAGAFAPFWFWTFTYARQYVTILPLGGALAELRKDVVWTTGAAPALWLLGALGAIAAWWDPRARRRAGFVAAFTLCSCVAVATGTRFTEHYFLLLMPAVSLLVGLAVSALARAAERAGPAVATSLRVGLPLVAVALTIAQERRFLFPPSPVALSRVLYGKNPFPEAVEIGRWLRAHTAPGETIAVIGSEPEIYFYAQRPAATTYIYMYPMMEPHPFARRMQEDMIAELERARPRYLVVVNVDWSWSRRSESVDVLLPWVERTVNADYDPVGLAEIVPGEETVYRWEAAADVPPRSRYFVATFRRRS